MEKHIILFVNACFLSHVVNLIPDTGLKTGIPDTVNGIFYAVFVEIYSFGNQKRNIWVGSTFCIENSGKGGILYTKIRSEIRFGLFFYEKTFFALSTFASSPAVPQKMLLIRGRSRKSSGRSRETLLPKLAAPLFSRISPTNCEQK